MSFDVSFVYLYSNDKYESYLREYTQFLSKNLDTIGICILNDEYIDIVVVPNDYEDIPFYVNNFHYNDVIAVIIVPEEYTTVEYVNIHLKKYIRTYQEQITEILLLALVKEKDYNNFVNNLRELLDNIIF